MGKLLLAGIGGFIGSSLRYAVSGHIQLWSKSIAFPYGTLAVNLIGCFAIGFLSQLAESRGMFTAETRTLIFIGVLGGFTTFSAFGATARICSLRPTSPRISCYVWVRCG